MAEIINMPRLSDTMEEGTVAKWLKNVGDKVEEGDILAEIETDKATMEFESFHEGVLLHIGIAEGDGAPVDSLLAIIGEEGEDISGLLKETSGSVDVAKKEDTAGATNEAPEQTTTDAPVAESAIPEGVEIIKMPRLSDTMEEGTVATWLKNVGDDVEEGDILAEIETDKATMEFESFYAGTLLYVGIKEGESSPVDEVLAVIGPKGTDVAAVLNFKPPGTSATQTAASNESKSSGESPETQQAAVITSTSNDGQRIFVSPLAKKMAEEKGIDLNSVQGSGDHGRIVKRDIENYTPSQKPAQATSTAAVAAPEVKMQAPETASQPLTRSGVG